jgi:fructokinase
MKVEVPAFIQENTIETTGAGDTFFGSALHFVLEKGLENLSEDDLTELLTFANAAASIITTRKGALKVMPSRAEVETLINK